MRNEVEDMNSAPGLHLLSQAAIVVTRRTWRPHLPHAYVCQEGAVLTGRGSEFEYPVGFTKPLTVTRTEGLTGA